MLWKPSPRDLLVLSAFLFPVGSPWADSQSPYLADLGPKHVLTWWLGVPLGSVQEWPVACLSLCFDTTQGQSSHTLYTGRRRSNTGKAC